MVIGVQYVLLPENKDYLLDAVKTLKNVGVDYFVIKPFVQQNHLQSYKIGDQFSLSSIVNILDEAENFSNVYIKTGVPFKSRNCFGISEFILNPLPPATIRATFFILRKY